MHSLIIQEIPYQANSEALFARVRDLPDAVWLDSGKPQSTQGRYDIISACPDRLIETRGNSSIIHNTGNQPAAVKITDQVSSEDPFTLAGQLLEPMLDDEISSEYPFVGGLIGYFAYDLGRRFIELSETAGSVTDLPDMRVGRFLWALVIDHETQRSELVFHRQCPQSLQTRISDRFSGDSSEPANSDQFKLQSAFSPTLSKSQYQSAIVNIKRYISAGDCYQTNFTQHFSTQFDGDLWPAYLALRNTVGSPYSVFWQWRDQGLLCLSPERFIKLKDKQAETKPIKGTIKRGGDAEEDLQRAEALIASQKDRAENLMIVDLLRNDLSRNCQPGSIQVPKLFALESFPNVHHLVSTVTGVLANDSTPLDLLRDSFPGGSITGAPKKRAMEIIEELEPVRRSVYCGSIGYISANRNMDTNIAIRTLIADGDTLHCWGGGGIVADSQEAQEYQESIDKIKALLTALEAFI